MDRPPEPEGSFPRLWNAGRQGRRRPCSRPDTLPSGSDTGTGRRRSFPHEQRRQGGRAANRSWHAACFILATIPDRGPEGSPGGRGNRHEMSRNRAPQAGCRRVGPDRRGGAGPCRSTRGAAGAGPRSAPGPGRRRGARGRGVVSAGRRRRTGRPRRRRAGGVGRRAVRERDRSVHGARAREPRRLVAAHRRLRAARGPDAGRRRPRRPADQRVPARVRMVRPPGRRRAQPAARRRGRHRRGRAPRVRGGLAAPERAARGGAPGGEAPGRGGGGSHGRRRNRGGA